MKAIQFLSELSTELLARYKKAAAADAKKADAAGDYERGNKRFKGINKATTKQFDNDAKKHKSNGSPTSLAEQAMQSWLTEMQGVAEGSDERKQNALWAQITAHEKAAKKSKDLKQQHHLKMADQLRSQLKTSDNEQGVAEGSLEEYGDTAKGQKMLTKVQKRAVDRVVSKKADTDPKYAKKNSDTADRAWDRMTDKDLSEIAGAFPSPSTRAKWAADAAASNAAEAKRLAAKQAIADAERLRVNNAIVDKEQRINYHPMPDNEIPTKEGVAETVPMNDAVKVLKHYGAEHFKTTSNELHFYKNGRGLSVDLVMNSDTTRSVTLSSLNSATRRLKGRGIAEVAMRMQGSSQSEKDANARAKALEAEEKAKHLAIVKAYVDIMAAGKPLPPRMQQSYNTMPDFRKEVDAALKNIPGQPGVVDLEQRKNYHLLPKNEGQFDWNARAKQLLASGLTEQQVIQQLVKEGCPLRQAQVYVQGAQLESISEWLAEEGKASRALCQGGKPDSELGASQLASCKSQGLRARDGDKSHLIGHAGSKVRIKVGGKKIKGKKYGGPLPDYGTRKGQL